MGFFSWITQDTGDSIPNNYSSRPTFTVYMTDNKGNVWRENDYEGYGIFGDKDFYVLLAEMNGFTGNDEDLRDKGIELAFSDNTYLSPNLNANKSSTWVNKKPEACPNQGFFYDDGDEEEEDDYEDDFDNEEDLDESEDKPLVNKGCNMKKLINGRITEAKEANFKGMSIEKFNSYLSKKYDNEIKALADKMKAEFDNFMSANQDDDDFDLDNMIGEAEEGTIDTLAYFLDNN